MKSPFFMTVAASMLVATVSVATAQTTTQTTTSWTNDQGTTITKYSETQKYPSINDPAMKPTVGMALPGSVTVYPLPPTVQVQQPDRYRYAIINNRPVVVEQSGRKVVHVW
jgi:hypothetical protein